MNSLRVGGVAILLMIAGSFLTGCATDAVMKMTSPSNRVSQDGNLARKILLPPAHVFDLVTFPVQLPIIHVTMKSQLGG